MLGVSGKNRNITTLTGENYCDNVMLVRYHICGRSPNIVLRVLTCINRWLPYSVTVLWSAAYIE